LVPLVTGTIMRLIAHRGFAANRPENTRRAIEEASAVADAVEIDVRRCGSGELVVIHDETVDRVSDGTGPVADHTLDELRALDVLGTGEGVPTLDAVLEAVPDAVGVNVDLKEADTAADAIATLSSGHPQPVVASASPDALAACRDADARVPRAYVVDEDDVSGAGADALDVAVGLECGYLHVAVDACSQSLVGEAHRLGLSVNAWTVDSRSEAATLADLGVDGIVSDRWAVRPEATR
jgi:glycerophosphoryl diester phosphodiesterase